MPHCCKVLCLYYRVHMSMLLVSSKKKTNNKIKKIKHDFDQLYVVVCDQTNFMANIDRKLSILVLY